MIIEEFSISLPPPPMLPWPMQCATHANLGWRFNVSEPSSEDTDPSGVNETNTRERCKHNM